MSTPHPRAGIDPASAPVPAAQLRDTLVTLRDLLRWAVSRLSAADVTLGQGTDELYDEAAWLLL